MRYNEYKEKLRDFISKTPSEKDVELFIEKHKNQDTKKKVSIAKASFSVLKDTNYLFISLLLTEDSIDHIKDIKFLNVMNKRSLVLLKNIQDNTKKEQLKKVYKKIMLNLIVENFFQEVENNNIEDAISHFEADVTKYYYLKNTAIKRVLKRLDQDSSIYLTVKEKFDI